MWLIQTKQDEQKNTFFVETHELNRVNDDQYQQ